MSTKPDVTDARKGIVKNTGYSLAGNVLPIIVAVFTIPLLIKGFGKEKFGILSLAWVLIGYFSLADFGLSRALTKFVSERIGQKKTDELPSLIWTALCLMTILGIIGAILLVLVSPVLVTSILKIESTNTKEIVNTFYLLSVGIPFTITAAGLRGILEAFMRFDLSNYVRIVLGVFNYVGPALVLLFSKNIMFVAVVLIVSRILCLLAYLWICFDVFPGMKKSISIHRSQVGPLLKFGGWITISNLISPIMVNFDRFFLGAMVSVSALAYYSTPWEVVARLLIIPSSLASVMFPVFSQIKGTEKAPNPGLYYKCLKHVLLIMFPLCLIFTAFAREILQIWLGHEFALNSFRVMQVMSVAVLINGLAMIPFSLIQASGRPDITAKFHLGEVVLYVPVMFLFIKKWGILGAAIAWLTRVTIDLALLIYYSNKSIYQRFTNGLIKGKSSNNKYFYIMFAIIILPIFMNNLVVRVLTVALVLIACWAVSWNVLLETAEKKVIADALGRNL